MDVWLQSATHHLSYKSVPFMALVKEAFTLWGYLAPEQEHLENRIPSRENAKKEGRTVQWVLDTELTDQTYLFLLFILDRSYL